MTHRIGRAPLYKRQERDRRRVVEDSSFQKGMYYTSNLVDSATSRILMNYDIRDRGRYITPRKGLRVSDHYEVHHSERPLKRNDKVPGVHAAFYGVYRDDTGVDRFGDIIVSFGIPNSPEYKYYDTDKASLDSSFYDQVYTNEYGDAFGILEDSAGDVYPIDMSEVEDTRLRFYNETTKPLFTVFNNKLYTIDGSAGEVVDVEDYESSGTMVKDMRFAYNGSMKSFIVRPLTRDHRPFTIDVRDPKGTVIKEIEVDESLLIMPRTGVYDYYDGVENILYERVRGGEFNELYEVDDLIVEEKQFTTFLKIPKPADSLAKGSVSSDIYGTFFLEGVDELEMKDQDVLDHTNHIGKYSTIADKDYIIYVMYQGSTPEDGLHDLMGVNYKYELLDVNEVSLGSRDPIEVKEHGRIVFDVPKGVFNLVVEYTINYQRPIYEYYGGIQEYSFNKSGDKFKAVPETIVAKVPKISEATSVGFNMLHSNPYSFANTESINLRPLGIMPYRPDSHQEILMSANLGEEIEFEVFYEYVKGQKYYYEWEYLPLGRGQLAEPVTLYESEKPIKAGDSIKLKIKANDERFSLRVTMWPEKDGKKDEARGQVVLYPLYEAGNTYLKDISEYEYDLHNATGIGSYKTMLALWGVPGAETTLFFSDIDDVSYFPFPNNIVSFQHKVLGIHEYMGGLLVFTTDSIYIIEGDQPHKFRVTEAYQGLTFTKEDLESLKVIKDMIFIRSGNNYYVITPNTYTGELTDVKLTLVSTPIKELLNEWDVFLKFLMTSVYDFDLEWTRHTEVFQYDFFNYISNDDVIKNIYRFVVKEPQKDRDRTLRYQIDIALNFHTRRGIWTLETLNLPFNEVVPHKESLYSSYAIEYGEGRKYFVQDLRYQNVSRKDLYNTMMYGYYYNDDANSTLEEELQELPEKVQATVKYVIDGDTIMTEEFGSVRFHYVDAPEDTEVSEIYGPEATQLMKDFLPEGSKITLEFEGRRSDKYQRVLAWVWNHEGELAQLALAEGGGVKAIYAFGAYRYADIIDEAVQYAVENQVGFWEIYEGDLVEINTYATEDLIPNYQVLDSGNKNHDPYLVKRYREIQFQISNRSEDNLVWFNRFYIEARPMQDFRHYELTHNTDPRSSDYGTVSVIPVDTANSMTSASTYLNTWSLGENVFPELDIIKIRFRVSGKGTYPRLLMISKNEADYDFLGYAWVMRMMNFR